MEYIFSTLITAVVFGILIVLLAAKPKASKFVTLSALVFSALCGLVIYGYGYAAVTDNALLAILQTVLAVSGSFLGNSEYDGIADAPLMQNQWMQILFTFVHICALYATASAVITSIGAQALKRLRLWFGRRGHLNVIYGTNENALHFGKELVAKKSGVVVFVSPLSSSDAATTVSDMGCVLLSDPAATAGDEKFLRRISFGKGKRSLTLYALDKDSNRNIQYATSLLKTLKSLGVSAERTSLVLIGQEEIAVSQLQQTSEQYGYGFVTAVNEPQMAARLLTMKYPPCNTLCFAADGKATENFEALVIGFGQFGQAILKSLVMNGQFEGSRFKLDVFAPGIHNADGNFTSRFASLLKQYDIHFYDNDARSRCMYDYLREHADTLRYIVIATGDDKCNYEIAEELIAYLNGIGRTIPIYQCSHNGVSAYHCDGTVEAVHSIFTTELLCSHTLDHRAMILNHKYQSHSGKTALQNWMECDYFSRQSCRAATDFIPAVLRAAGKSAEQAAQGDWALSAEQIENLSRTEHLRWCAFHYCMGFSTMDDKEFAERAETYRRQKDNGGKPAIRIGKNMPGRTHACLIPWEDLDNLSAKESAITGKDIDYKAMDTDNVMTIPQLLQATE